VASFLRRSPVRHHGFRRGILVQSLLRDDLIDELRLMVHPVVVGGGKRLFEDAGDHKAFELVVSRTFATGVLYLTYRLAVK
jgi:dihydrofolate reductase